MYAPLRAACLAVPGLALSAAGAFHPAELTAASAHHWWLLHVLLMPLFPLLGLALLPLIAPGGTVLSTVTTVFVYIYSVFYSALDILTGIGAGIVIDINHVSDSSAVVTCLVDTGNQLAWIGTISFLAAALFATFDPRLRWSGIAVVPSVLLIAGSVTFLDSHIYWPSGGLSVFVIGASTGWLYHVKLKNEGRITRKSWKPRPVAGSAV